MAIPHLVLSRKYRPQRFEDLVGQEHVAQTLRNAITSGRVGHAYLFIGPRGTGKTTTARIFAKALNCEGGPTPTPCGTCDSCVSIAAGSDLDVVEMDAASNNGVDDVRALRDSVGYRPARSRYRVWIVDEVHMLSLPAFNAFLKTLEEPPPQAKFLFCTTEAHKLPETFISRVQRLEFRRIDEGKMADRLRGLVAREGVTVEDGVIERIASGALGGLRDAESLLEQLLSSATGGRVALADLDAVIGRAPADRVAGVFDAVLAGDAGAALDAADACLDLGGKPDVVLDQWIDELRAMLILSAHARGAARSGASASSAATSPDAAGLSSVAADRASRMGLARVARSIDLLIEKRRSLRDGADARLVVELAAVELARLPSARDLDALIDALRSGAASRGDAAPAEALPRGARDAGAAGSAPSRNSTTGLGSGARAAAATSPARRAPLADAVGESTPPTGSGAASLTRDDVASRWGDVLSAAARDRRLASALTRARVVAVDGGSIVLGLAEADGYARAYLRDRSGQEAFRSATSDVLGVALRPIVAEDAASAPATPIPSPGGAADVTAASGRPRATSAPAAALSAAPNAASGGVRTDAGEEARRHPDVKAVLDAFGARLLAVQRVEGVRADAKDESEPAASPS